MSGIYGIHLRNRSSIEELKRHIPKILSTLGGGLIFYIQSVIVFQRNPFLPVFVVELQAVNIDAQGGNCSIWTLLNFLDSALKYMTLFKSWTFCDYLCLCLFPNILML